jgi:signal transduction histidine kinase
MHRQARSLEQHMADLVAYFVRPGSERQDTDFWQDFMRGVFLPASMALVPRHGKKVTMANDGSWIRVPTFQSETMLELRLPDRGGRLFNEEDRRAAQALFDMACRARQHRQAYQQGVKDERRRIMRDLHDDVGGRLLSLVHSATDDDQRRLAGEALDSLREVIYFTLEGEENTQLGLGDLLGRWRAQVRERLERSGIRLEWAWHPSCDEVLLPAPDALNLGRILYECVSNALRHSSARSIAIRGEVRRGILRVEIVNDGLGEAIGKGEIEGFGGKGIYNIRQRAGEMGGDASFAQEGGKYVVRLALPVGRKPCARC